MWPRRFSTRHSIRERLLVAMLSLLFTLLATLTYLQIQSQQEILKEELSRREKLMREQTRQQSEILSQNLGAQVEAEMSGYNFSQAATLIAQAVEQNMDLRYGILMDNARVAHTHTAKKELEMEMLNDAAAFNSVKRTVIGWQPVKYRGEVLNEFITPIKLASQPWGVLRLGFSMNGVDKEMADSRREIEDKTRTIIINSLITTVVFLVVGVGIVAMIAARISEPLIKLTQSAHELAAGNFSAQTPTRTGTNDEIDQLARAFSDMAKDLKQTYEQLEESNLTLEHRVEERTAELNSMVEKLRQTNDELEQSQAELARAERMASLGRLVAGVAHEINTPVGIGITCASHLHEKTHEVMRLFDDGTIKKGDLRRYLEVATESCDLVLNNLNRTGDLVKSFKMVSADTASEERREYDLHMYLSDILLSLGPNLKKAGHKVSLNCPDSIEMDGYPGALAQVITNLVMNSLNHAFEPGKQGNMEINASVEDENTVKIVFTDDGKGIAKEHIDKIFDPFFTTKRGKGGTGLGLNIVYNLVHDTLLGNLTCESESGQGVRFELTMPRQIAKDTA